MQRLPFSIAALACFLLAVRTPGRAQDPTEQVSLGTYDSRAIAIAYAASKYNPVGAKMKELEAAKAAGNRALVAELEAWGEAHQRQLHRQGFGRVPVDDLLAPVRGELSEVAARAGVEAITWQCDWVGPGARTVDVTDELVALFDPSERTLANIAGIRATTPVDLDELERSHDH